MSNMAMPLTSASTVTEENITTPNKELSMSRQSTSHLLLIEPEVFYANPETMDTNVYQIDQQESQGTFDSSGSIPAIKKRWASFAVSAICWLKMVL